MSTIKVCKGVSLQIRRTMMWHCTSVPARTLALLRGTRCSVPEPLRRKPGAGALPVAIDGERICLPRLAAMLESQEQIAPKEQPVAALRTIRIRGRLAAKRFGARGLVHGGGDTGADEERISFARAPDRGGRAVERAAACAVDAGSGDAGHRAREEMLCVIMARQIADVRSPPEV